MFYYDDKDLIFTTSWKSLSVNSKFDESLKSLWKQKEDEGLFRYKYKEENVITLPGKYGFLAVVSLLDFLYLPKIGNYSFYWNIKIIK